jgi:hypothetical protein
MKEYGDFTRIGPSRGSNQGGLFEYTDGSRYYLKLPNSTTQASNEILASRYYQATGFDAIQYEEVSNGMVAAPFREDLPRTSDPDALKESTEVLESFMPSALIANWDVIGLVYDNCLYDPATMSGPVFLDFGGSFDTRAMGGYKEYTRRSIRAYNGFTDRSLNQSATNVYSGLSSQLFARSKERALGVSRADMEAMMRETPMGVRDDLLSRYVSRLAVMEDTPYTGVF